MFERDTGYLIKLNDEPEYIPSYLTDNIKNIHCSAICSPKSLDLKNLATISIGTILNGATKLHFVSM